MADTPQPDDFQSLTRKPPYSFAAENLSPPGPVFVTPDDVLDLFYVFKAVTGDVTVRARVMEPSGRITTIQQNITAAKFAGGPIVRLPLLYGYLLSATVSNDDLLMHEGEFFCQLRLVRGLAAAAQVQQVLTSGYVTIYRALSWPGGPLNSPRMEPGRLLLVTPSDPSNNSDVQIDVPAGAVWRVMSIYFAFTASAAAANRFVGVSFWSAGGNFGLYHGVAPTAETAGNAIEFSFGVGLPNLRANQGSNSIRVTMPLPDGMLLPGTGQIYAGAANKDADDRFDSVTLWVEEWVAG